LFCFAFQDGALACVAEVLSNQELSALPDELQQQLFDNVYMLLTTLPPAVRVDWVDVVVHMVQLVARLLPAATVDIVNKVGVVHCRSTCIISTNLN
jgi:hypothetical protein